MSNLTSFQQKLVDDLIKEFTKINPKPNDGGTKRFSFETITECNKEEERFKATITKHNMTMMKVFLGQLDDDIEAFKKEFGKVLDIQVGYTRKDNVGVKEYHSIETLKTATNERPFDNNHFREVYLYLVSKTKKHYDNSSVCPHGECNGMAHTQLYVGFNYERVEIILESGKRLVAYKIVGLLYSTFSYLHRDKHGVTKGTLDELIQSDKNTQQNIVRLADVK